MNSLGMLGSTGNYAYLSRDERRAVLEAAVDAAEGVPVIAGWVPRTPMASSTARRSSRDKYA
ncbi:dihydrodipicolinate synthase family protein [Arthrobacter crystallopoietes]|uniref:dihydrodipicolinate synthase family protein n=1 Tax=Crystallibacter crystallopoietes TaxID=37928 RepID=UPI003138F5AE